MNEHVVILICSAKQSSLHTHINAVCLLDYMLTYKIIQYARVWFDKIV